MAKKNFDMMKQNNEDFFKIWASLKIIQILVIIEDIWRLGQNWRFFKVW